MPNRNIGTGIAKIIMNKNKYWKLKQKRVTTKSYVKLNIASWSITGKMILNQFLNNYNCKYRLHYKSITNTCYYVTDLLLPPPQKNKCMLLFSDINKIKRRYECGRNFNSYLFLRTIQCASMFSDGSFYHLFVTSYPK